MENKNAELIRKMISLQESIDSKIIADQIITENENIDLNEDFVGKYVKDIVNVSQGTKRAAAMGKLAAEFEGPLKNMLKNAESASLLRKANIRTAEELVVAISKGLSPKLKGSLELTILKSPTTNMKLVDAAAENLTRNKDFLAKYKESINGGQVSFEKALKGKYSENAITKIVDKVNKKYGMKVTDDMIAGSKVKPEKTKTNVGSADDAAKTADDAKKIEQGKKIIFGGGKKYHEWLKKIWEQGKNKWKFIGETGGVKKYMVPRSIVKWALVAGGAYLLYSLLTSSDGSDVIIVDEGGTVIDPNLTDGMAECLRNLIDKGTGQLTTSGKGDPVVVVKKTGNSEYDDLGGLAFFMNGRVWTLDFKTKRGTWTCKNSKIQTVNEIELNEASSELSADVDRMIDYLDFPVSSDDLQNAKKLLQKYVDNGQGKKFLQIYDKSGLMDYPLRTTLDYIATFKASSVEAKQDMYAMINKIESGKGGGEQGGGTADLSGISITWDGDKPPVPVPPVPVPPVPQPEKYRYCDKFPFTFGCKNPKIQDVQRCLGMESKYQTGNFGPLTLSVMRNKFGMDVIDELTYNGIMSKCKGGTPTPTTGNTTTTGSTITPPKPAEPTKPTEPTKVEPANVGSATKTTTLNRESCKSLFKTIDERDQQQGVATASKTEREQLKFCLQQYNFGVGTGASRMKRRYGLTASGGDRGIK